MQPVTALATVGAFVPKANHAKLAAIMVNANTFALTGMIRWHSQSRTYKPSTGCSRTQWARAGDDFANAHSATRRNGVVGRRGSATPAMANPTHVQPSSFNRTLTNFHNPISYPHTGLVIAFRHPDHFYADISRGRSVISQVFGFGRPPRQCRFVSYNGEPAGGRSALDRNVCFAV